MTITSGRVGLWLGVAGFWLTVTAGSASVDAQGGPRVWVLDSAAQTVSTMDIASGKLLETARIEGAPTRLMRVGGGRRILALDQGEGNDFGEQEGFLAKTKSAVTIIDGGSLAVVGRVELGTGLAPEVMVSADGERLSVLCPGYRSKKPAERRPRELITVDLAAGKVLSRIELAQSPEVVATPDGRTLLVLSKRETGKAAAPAQLMFIDATTGAVAATVPLEGDPRGPVLAPGGEVLYLLDRGKPSNNPDKNQNGRLYAVSIATRTVTMTDAGSNPRGLVLDEDRNQLLLLSDGQPVKGPANRNRDGELRAIRGGSVGTPLPVTSSPERIVSTSDSLYVVSFNGFTRLDLPELTAFPTVALRLGLGQTTISPDGRRAWVTLDEYFTTFDLEQRVRLAEVKTGRTGKKLLLGLGAALHTESSRLTAKNQAREEGSSYYTYTEYTVKAGNHSFEVRPDGREIYALNSQTSDVTIIDADSGQIIEKVAAGGFAVLFMPSVSAALIPSSAKVSILDMASHTKQPELIADSAAGFEGAELSPDAKLAVVYGPKGILFVNASTGKVAGTLVGGEAIADVVFDWGR